MAKVVGILEGEYPQKCLRRHHPLLGPATISVGSIKGGNQPNIVPAECVITVDRRTLPGETDQGVIAELQASFRRRGLRPGVRKLHSVPCPALETDAQLPLVRRFMKAAGQRQPSGVVFFSDAAVLASAGIPSVLFGPGDIAQAHTADEWVAVSQLERGKGILTKFLQSLE
jgi:acetylornithine deacetylase/succinyl-diaminopimelate desuccinylase-like protein